MTPHDIQLLLHIHCTVGPWPLGKTDAYTRSITTLSEMGVIDIYKGPPWTPGTNHHGFMTTPKGHALVNALCSTEVPETRVVSVSQYRDPVTGDWLALR